MNLSSPEFYQLVCCTKKCPLEVNGEIVVFQFDGKAYNENYPDKFFNKTIGNISTISKIKIPGCFELEDITDSCDSELYKVLAWETFFMEAEVFDKCCDCLPEEPDEERIYLQKFEIERAKDPCYEVFANYASIWYRDALKRIEGIEMCCPPNKVKAIVEYEVLIRERNRDPFACCPPCVQVDIFLPAATIGTYTYTNCEAELIEVDVDVVEDTTQRICVCTNAFENIVFTGTSSGFLATPLGIPCAE